MNDGDVHWDEWLAQREKCAREVAAFINAEPDEIGFTTNTSSGMNLIVDALGETWRSDLVRSRVSRDDDSVDAPAYSGPSREVG